MSTRQAAHAGRSHHEGQHQVSFSLHKDSVTSLSTAGVLGETYIDIDSSQAKGPRGRGRRHAANHDTPEIQDVVRSSQSTLQNLDAL